MTSTRLIHLVDSMNLASAEEAMLAAASTIGEGLLRLSDGEPGPRRSWIYYQRPLFTHKQFLDVPSDWQCAGLPEISAPPNLARWVRFIRTSAVAER